MFGFFRRAHMGTATFWGTDRCECRLSQCINNSDATARPNHTSSCSTITAIQDSCMVALKKGEANHNQ